MWHLECGRDFEVNQNCNTLPCSFVSDIAIFVLKRDVKLQLTNPVLWQTINGSQRIWNEGTAGCRMLLCISCTSVVQCEQMVVLRSAGMRNFSAAQCGKVVRGNLRTVLHLIFRKLPLDNFLHLVVRIPQNTRAGQNANFPPQQHPHFTHFKAADPHFILGQ